MNAGVPITLLATVSVLASAAREIRVLRQHLLTDHFHRNQIASG
jgi:hypothetical protein